MSRDDLPLFEGEKYDFSGKYCRVVCNWTATVWITFETQGRKLNNHVGERWMCRGFPDRVIDLT